MREGSQSELVPVRERIEVLFCEHSLDEETEGMKGEEGVPPRTPPLMGMGPSVDIASMPVELASPCPYHYMMEGRISRSKVTAESSRKRSCYSGPLGALTDVQQLLESGGLPEQV